MFIHDTLRYFSQFDSRTFLQSPRGDSSELRESISPWLNVLSLVDVFLSSWVILFFKISFILFFSQGIRGPVGLPGPVGLKGEQVHKIKIVVCLLIFPLVFLLHLNLFLWCPTLTNVHVCLSLFSLSLFCFFREILVYQDRGVHQGCQDCL